MSDPIEPIDAWRERNWGCRGACPCGDPVFLADTESWETPRCFDCWVRLGEPKWEPKTEHPVQT